MALHYIFAVKKFIIRAKPKVSYFNPVVHGASVDVKLYIVKYRVSFLKTYGLVHMCTRILANIAFYMPFVLWFTCGKQSSWKKAHDTKEYLARLGKM